MRKQPKWWLVAMLALTWLAGCAQTPQPRADAGMAGLIDEQLRFAAAQYQLLAQATPADRMPKTFENGKQVDSDIEWWTSGFYPGTLWLISEGTGDAAIRAEAERRLDLLEPSKYYTGNHDIGFMIFSSFGNAYRITGNPRYKAVVDTAAQTATNRYRPRIGAIQSWDSSQKFKAPVIIDNLMNLELLLWAAQNGGDARLREIALRHADITLRNHFRPDYSSYHVVDYDPDTGKVLARKTAQGADDASAWARGQAWALYGYTMLYRYTRDPRYLAQARGVADFILGHPNLPADDIPYWDFNAPGIPEALRDASAAAIMASALLELGQYADDARTRYVGAAETMLRSLSAPPYRAALGGNGGFLLQHSVGALPMKSEVDVPLTYADYYFVEALLRYRRWYLPEG